MSRLIRRQGVLVGPRRERTGRAVLQATSALVGGRMGRRFPCNDAHPHPFFFTHGTCARAAIALVGYHSS